MRIYNGTSMQLDIPLAEQRLTIPAKSVSGNFLPNNAFLSLMVSSFDYSEIALIVSGSFEINMCSQISCCAGFVVNSLEEAIMRSGKDEKPSTKNPAMVEDTKVEEKPVAEEPKEPVAEVAAPEEVKPEPKEEAPTEPVAEEAVAEEKPKRKRLVLKKSK